MDWPARSPDLNPIEHVWEFLGRRLAARTLPPPYLTGKSCISIFTTFGIVKVVILQRGDSKTQPSIVCREGILYKGTLAHNPRCSRLRGSRRSYTTSIRPTCCQMPGESCTVIHRSYGAGVDRRALTIRRPLLVFRVVRCLLVHCFQTHSTEKLFRCIRATIAR
ncbi:hypothetical protein TNCV_3674131 [Trichonephila clavipes]|nr:hypothetical protein TNCV_3674131 [Trichonephila clavipes]